LGRFKSSLGIIAWADALTPALQHDYVRGLMAEKLGINVVDRANEILKELDKLREKVQELMRDKEFMSYVEPPSIKADEKAVRRTILDTASHLKDFLAYYRLHNDELKEAEGLFKEAAEEKMEIGNYEGYIISRAWALCVEAIEGSLVGGKLVDEFRQLYEEMFNEEHFKITFSNLTNASEKLGYYLVSLALTGGDEGVKKIKELLEDYRLLLYEDEEVSVPTRLMLNALLGPRGELSSELGGGLVVAPRELIEAFKDEIFREFLPALMVTFGVIKPENGIKLCEEFIDESTQSMQLICKYSVLAVKGNSVAVKQLREGLISFHILLKEEMVDLLKKLGFDANSLNYEFERLVGGLDGKSLVQLLAPSTSRAQLVLMLYALINGDEKLAKAHALMGAVGFSDKLTARLFLDVYRTCEKGCNLSNEDLRQAITKLFILHI